MKWWVSTSLLNQAFGMLKSKPLERNLGQTLIPKKESIRYLQKKVVNPD